MDTESTNHSITTQLSHSRSPTKTSLQNNPTLMTCAPQRLASNISFNIIHYFVIQVRERTARFLYIRRPKEVRRHEGSVRRLPGHGKNQLLHLQYHESQVLAMSPLGSCRYCNITHTTITLALLDIRCPQWWLWSLRSLGHGIMQCGRLVPWRTVKHIPLKCWYPDTRLHIRIPRHSNPHLSTVSMGTRQHNSQNT
jgi:hypothetical protein